MILLFVVQSFFCDIENACLNFFFVLSAVFFTNKKEKEGMKMTVKTSQNKLRGTITSFLTGNIKLITLHE